VAAERIPRKLRRLSHILNIPVNLKMEDIPISDGEEEGFAEA